METLSLETKHGDVIDLHVAAGYSYWFDRDLNTAVDRANDCPMCPLYLHCDASVGKFLVKTATEMVCGACAVCEKNIPGPQEGLCVVYYNAGNSGIGNAFNVFSATQMRLCNACSTPEFRHEHFKAFREEVFVRGQDFAIAADAKYTNDRIIRVMVNTDSRPARNGAEILRVLFTKRIANALRRVAQQPKQESVL